MFKTTLNRRQALIGMGSVVVAPSMSIARELPLGIIFVGASWCSVCHKTAPILKSIADQLGVAVLVASADNLPIAPFENHVSAIGHPLTEAIRAYPKTLVFSSIHKEVLGSVTGFRNQKWFSDNLIRAMQLAGQGKRFKAGTGL